MHAARKDPCMRHASRSATDNVRLAATSVGALMHQSVANPVFESATAVEEVAGIPRLRVAPPDQSEPVENVVRILPTRSSSDRLEASPTMSSMYRLKS